MTSSRKSLLAATALLALVCAAASACGAIAGILRYLTVQQMQGVLLFMALPLGWCTLIWALLLTEFARVRGIGFENGELSVPWSQARLMLSWCPAAYGLTYLVAFALVVLAIFTVGSAVSWSSGEPFTREHAIGFPLFAGIWLFIIFPFLVSAARMPGAYAQHLRLKL